MKKRLGYPDIAKALCIILVVVGHFCPSTTSDLWSRTSAVIYSFHMPLFMFISGLLLSYTWKREPYTGFIAKKFQRLMIPYFSTSMLIITIKMLMQNIMPVANRVTPQSLLEMMWYPSAALHLWFVWALMIMFTVAAVSPSRLYRSLLTCVAVAVWLLPVNAPHIFCLDMVCGMAVFFMAGVQFCDLGGLKILDPADAEDRFWAACVFPACTAAFVTMEILLFNGRLPHIFERLLPFLGIMTTLWVSRCLSGICRDKGVLITIGRCSFTIFLLHSIFLECTKAVMSRLGFTLEHHFILCLACSTAAGVLLPILVQKLVFERSKVLGYLFGAK